MPVSSEFLYVLIRFGYLALLWIFVLAAILVLRRDVFGQAVGGRRRARARASAARKQKKGRSRGTIVLEPHALSVTGGPQAGASLPLGSSAIRVGRSNACNLVLDDSYASSQHARFYKSDGDWYVEDLGSTNGTFVEGERLTSPRRLSVGTEVRIGQTIMELSR
ncbi:MAG: FHA domain-containing protein [Actinomycetaceae bacterium]|nr:FHA domain-containing protein [Actinomycetaceae bacterium]MDU0971100.1 FHA domain-containing protein [Actinomycetaceae bacterium]